MALNNDAAGSLSGKINVGSVYLRSVIRNVIKFSILRASRDVGNVDAFPPDCELEVVAITKESSKDIGSYEEICVTGKIFTKQVEYSGTMKNVSDDILRECRGILFLSAKHQTAHN